MTKLFEQAKVLLSTFVTYVVLAQAVLTAVLVELQPFSDVAVIGGVLNYGGAILTVLGAIVAIVRRVTQVSPELRGVLVPPVDHGF